MAHTTNLIDVPTVSALTAAAPCDHDLRRQVYWSRRRADTMRQTYARMSTSLKHAFVQPLTVRAAR